jgi:hypothetical protein
VDGGRNPSLPGTSPDSSSPRVLPGSSQSNVPAASGSASRDLAEAKRLYLRRDYDAAIQLYKAVLQNDPKSAEAYAGLARAYFCQKNIQQAYETAMSGLKATDAPAIHVELGGVYYRQGKIAEAEQEWMGVINKGTPSARAYWGLSLVRAARSLHQQAKVMLDKAHELDPEDTDITNRWIRSLSRTKQIEYWENRLAAASSEDKGSRASMRRRLDYLKSVQSRPHHSCRPVNRVAAAEMKLTKFSRRPLMRAYGLESSLNGRKGTLLLDTGGPGILISKEWAQEAGITGISETEVGGISDKGVAVGYIGFADSLKIGGMEFQGCRVKVNETGPLSGAGNAGIVGADIFSAFLVEIDFPNQKLRLQPLPKRPDETAAEGTVEAATESPAYTDDQSSGENAPAGGKQSRAARRGPQDRYIAPEMQSYTQVFRFGNFLLVPTRIGDSDPRLFALGTGGTVNLLDFRSSPNLMSMLPSQEKNGPRTLYFTGINGSFPAYNSDHVDLQFGGLRLQNQTVFNCDLSHLSDQVGTEISGILGLDALHLLRIRIDYRDGLVDFAE